MAAPLLDWLIPPAYAADGVNAFQVDYGTYLLNVSLLILLTLALGYVAYRLRHRQGFARPILRPRGRQVQVLERTPLEGMKSLYLVKCGDKHWVIGSHETGLTVVGEAQPPEPSFEADLHEALHEEKPPGLGDFLRRIFMGRAAWLVGFLLLSLAMSPAAFAADGNLLDAFDLRQAVGSKELSTPMQMIIFMALLTLLPFLFIMTTSFLRTIIVLGLLRSAMGTQQVPPNQIIMGLSIFLTIYTMSPVWSEMNQNALTPYLNNQITQSVAVERGLEPLKKFMLKQIRKDELAFFVRLVKIPPPRKPTDIPLHVVVPAFIVSELSTAFKIGFMLFLPFLVIDLVVANTLLALGMMMLSPVTISLPFKILIFTLADGWTLLIQSIVRSFQ